MKTVRIFLSSPGDVGAEREMAREIFERLQVEFSGLLEIAPYFWEHEPMRAHTDFQTQIEPPSKFDLFVCLLWARLGSRLHPGLHRKADGSEYASGTEYELLDALEEFRRSQAPEVLIYKRLGDPVIPAKPKEERERILSQYDALESFFARLTQEDGHFVVGTNSYAGLEQFETKFENDMRKVLARFVPEGVAGSRIMPKSWTGDSPFRGLRYFDFEHAPIFFGRTRAIDEVLAALKQQAADDCAFVLVFGGSGVGKSSLVRAGVLPWLVKPGVIDGIALWRRAVMRPSEVNEGDLFDALSAALMRPEGLPEIGSDGTSVDALAAALREKPDGVGMLIKGALSQAARDLQLSEKLEKQPRALFALAIDQLEELFTVERLASQREGFLRAIDALARSGYVWVLATLRSDFYPRCEESPLLMELKKGAGQYHLQPPDEVQLGQMIRLPASAAGLLFEEDHKTGERLDDFLRDAAVKSPAALPLLEFALEELYEQRDQDKNLLKLEAYRALGGVEGALGKRAEESFQQAGASAQVSFDPIFRQLVTISAGEGEPAVRRRARKAEVESTAGAGELVDRLTTGRLLVADRTEEGVIVIGLAHEAMLASWPRLAQWVERNRESLKVRAQVAADAGRWIENNRNPDYLYDAGLPLEKARVAKQEGFLDASEKEFVEASVRQVAAEASQRVKVLRRWLAAVGVFAILACVAGGLAFAKKREAEAQKRIAQTAQGKAVAAKKAADALINYMQYELSDTLEKLGHLHVMQGINARIRKYHEEHPGDEGDPEARHERSVSLRQQGELLMAQGDLASAAQLFREVLEIRQALVAQDPANTHWQTSLSGAHDKIGNMLTDKGDLAGALKNYRDGLAIREKLAKQDPANADRQRNLYISYIKIGDVLMGQGDVPGARQVFEQSIAICIARVEKNPEDEDWIESLSISAIKMGDTMSAQGDLPKALSFYRKAQTFVQKVATKNPVDTNLQRHLSVIHEKESEVLSAQRDLPGALESARRCLAIREKLAAHDTQNAIWKHDLSVSHNKVGRVLHNQGNLAGALQSYRQSFELRKALAKQDPTNAEWQGKLAISQLNIGDVLSAQGDLAEALQNYRDGLTIFLSVSKNDPTNVDWKQNVAIAHGNVGNVLKAQGDLPSALQSYRESLAIRQQLADADPAKPYRQNEVLAAHDHIAEVLAEQKDLTGALELYRASLAIAEKLAAQDPANNSRQRQLSLSHDKVGTTLSEQEEFTKSLEHYRASVAIAEKLAQQDPANLEWQRDLSIGYHYLGDTFSRLENFPEALKFYRQCLDLRRALLKKDPANTEWQSNLSLSLGHVAETLLTMPDGDRKEAARCISEALGILAELAKKKVATATNEQSRAWLEELRKKTGVRR